MTHNRVVTLLHLNCHPERSERPAFRRNMHLRRIAGQLAIDRLYFQRHAALHTTRFSEKIQ